MVYIEINCTFIQLNTVHNTGSVKKKKNTVPSAFALLCLCSDIISKILLILLLFKKALGSVIFEIKGHKNSQNLNI